MPDESSLLGLLFEISADPSKAIAATWRSAPNTHVGFYQQLGHAHASGLTRTAKKSGSYAAVLHMNLCQSGKVVVKTQLSSKRAVKV